jgi:hypothetical protein
MDVQYFDALARSLAAGPTRRRLLAGLVSGLLAMPALSLTSEVADAKKKCSCKGKTCGCKGKCGTCGPNESCTKGQCVPNGCTPACEGGMECQTNGTCACPAGKPHFCNGSCRECCTEADCGSAFAGKTCDHNNGSVCVCSHEHNQDCGDGICWPCCTSDHCEAYHRSSADGYICNVNHACVCQDGTSECLKPDQSGYYCADTNNDEQNCGSCGFTCDGWTCNRGRCLPPG